ncbi:DUF2017 domain-containing protein [Thalassiella azotivora]
MATAFRRDRDGAVACGLDEGERDLLTRLFLDVAEMLEGGLADDAGTDPLTAMVGIAEDAREPDDPALARLLPNASRDDGEVAAEFRRYTETGLRRRKSRNLRRAVASLHERRSSSEAGEGAGERRRGRRRSDDVTVRLDDETAGAWLTALTDVRLVLAERVGVRTDEDAEALSELASTGDPDDPRAWLAAVYDFLTWLQETLVHAVLPGAADPPGQD